MEIDFVRSKEEWNDFLKENNGSFLQSTDWGDFKEKYQRVYRIEARKRGKIVGVCQFFEEKSPIGEYFYIPHGPFAKDKEIRTDLLLRVEDIGRSANKFFIKAEPLQEISVGEKPFFRVQPTKTLVSDISGGIAEVVSGFDKNTRYSIRYATKKGVFVKEEQKVEDFYKLLQKTTKRHHFKTYHKDYFKDLLAIRNCYLLLAVYGKDIVAGVVFICFGSTVSFLHSASDYNMRNLRAPALLRMKVIEHAKKKGCERYDFWGIDEKRFPGVTVYKKGFGGKEVVYPEGRDLVLKPFRYKGYKAVKKMKSFLIR